MSFSADKTPDRITPGKAPEPLAPSTPSGGAPTEFDRYMQGSGGRTPPGMQAAQTGPTPMEMAKGASISTSGISFDSLLAQAGQVQDSLGTVEKQLGNQNLKLKRSQTHLVRQKLGDAGTHIRAAASKMGLNLEEGKVPSGLDTLSRFIAMVNDGQDQLSQVQEQLKKMSASGANVNPGDMLSIQVKMGIANQEIQYTTTLLGKVIQSFTQLLNTQL